jgi:endonuclease/exonuclease/phosphatase family metal-dependent hydrolase
MKLRGIAFSFLLLSISLNACSQQNKKTERATNSTLRIMFYNTENLFDTQNDSTTNDDEYTPKSKKHWTNDRYTQKINNLYKVIIAIGGWEPPEIIGLCEVENRSVLNNLLKNTLLSKYEYGIVHRNSPDPRGIDIALLYRRDKVKILSHTFIHFDFPNEKRKRTRESIYARYLVNQRDTLHVFVNHFPSRVGGDKKTEHLRMYTAKIIRLKCDSILKISPQAKIIIMGDFNDTPSNLSISKSLGAQNPSAPFQANQLYNLAQPLALAGKGTHKYRGEWSLLDQIIVSGNLLNAKNLHCEKEMKIFDSDFIMIDEKDGMSKRPRRTYNGRKYEGGFSDHLPVYIDLN